MGVFFFSACSCVCISWCLVDCLPVFVIQSVSLRLLPALSVGRSVSRLVRHTLLFFMVLFLWPHCSCPNGLLTSNMAPAHPHATSVAVYPALLFHHRSFLLLLQKKFWSRSSSSWKRHWQYGDKIYTRVTTCNSGSNYHLPRSMGIVNSENTHGHIPLFPSPPRLLLR